MMENAYKQLLSVVLPKEVNEFFDLVNVVVEPGMEGTLHMFLDEKALAPDDRQDLTPNGFYAESLITHFPICDHKTILHVRRRRWKDAEGKSVSKDWDLVAKGTRFSKEFAAFLKDAYGYGADNGPIPGAPVPFGI